MADYIHVSNGDGVPATAIVTTDRGVGSTNLIVDTVLNWAVYGIAMSGTIDTLTDIISDKTVFKYHLEGSIIIIDEFAPGYTDIGNFTDQVVILKPTIEWANEVADLSNDIQANTTSIVTTNTNLTTLSDSVVKKIDTSLAGNGFFIDDANLAANDATKVPSQKSVKSYVDNKYAFKAWRKNALNSASSGSIDVVFDTEYYDTGNCYSTSTGLFTAPVNGIYSFIASFFTEGTTITRSFPTSRGTAANPVERTFDQDTSFNRRTSGRWELYMTAGQTFGTSLWTSASGNIGASDTWFAGHLVQRMS